MTVRLFGSYFFLPISDSFVPFSLPSGAGHSTVVCQLFIGRLTNPWVDLSLVLLSYHSWVKPLNTCLVLTALKMALCTNGGRTGVYCNSVDVNNMELIAFSLLSLTRVFTFPFHSYSRNLEPNGQRLSC